MKVEDVRDEWRQVARMAFTKAFASTDGTCALDAALAAVIPAIQAEALERAAVVATDAPLPQTPFGIRHAVGEAIRALKEGT
jgi:hypothetical protein